MRVSRLPLGFIIALGAAAGCGRHAPSGVADPSRTTKSAADTASAVPATFRDEPDGPKPDGMVWVPGGSFWMGFGEARGGDAEPFRR